MYKSIIYSIILFAIALCLNCGTGAETEHQQTWKEIGLQNQEVQIIEYAEGFLFAGSKEGVYRLELQSGNAGSPDLGLEINSNISSIGDILYTGDVLYVVKRNIVDFSEVPEDYISLYKSTNVGADWEGLDIELEDREKPFVINRIAQANNSSALYADWHLIFKSTDHGRTWENLTKGSKVGVSEFLYVSEEHPNQIWTGGWTNLFTPYLAKSEDAGATWVTLNQSAYFGVYSLIFEE